MRNQTQVFRFWENACVMSIALEELF